MSKKNTSKKNNKNEVKNENNTKAKNKKITIEEEVKEEIEEVVEDEIEEVIEDEDMDFDEEELDDEETDELDEEEVEEDEIDNEDDDEDLEDEDDEEEEETIIIKEIKKEEKPKAEKQKIEKTKKEKKEKIEKIEKIAKSKQKKTNKKNNLENFINLFEKYNTQIFSFIGGALLVTLIAFLIWPDRIATLKDGTQPVVKVGGKTYTANKLYENMKDYYSVSLLLDQIDKDLLTKIYPENDEMNKEVESNAQYYINMYKQYYNYTEEEFLEKNGFSSYNAFLDYLKLENRRNKYLEDYVKENTSDDEIKKYYDEKVYGDINTQHILVEVKSSDEEDGKKLSDEDAKALAEEIITKLNDGTSWDAVKEEYKDRITFEDLGYQAWDASLEKTFMDGLKNLEDNSYSTEPVKTSYGYHVIYRLDQKKKASLKKSKDKIIENIISEKKSEDQNLLYKALISLREDKHIKFSDTVMNKKYNTYCKQYK